MSISDKFSYHELKLKAVSQMRNLQGKIDPVFLKDDVVSEIENNSSFFGLIYLIGLMQRLKTIKDQSLDDFFKGAFYKRKTPFLIGVSGAVSVGKSTFAKKLADSLHQIYPNQKIEIVSTDDFLHSNSYLQDHDLMEQKGFPVSFDNEALWDFLVNAASFNESQDIPIYDHQTYDILDHKRRVRSANFIIVEGINTLQDNPVNGRNFSEMLDLTIFLEASEEDIIAWFLKRLNKLLDAAEPGSYYEKFAELERSEAEEIGKEVYAKVNQPNFEKYIAPTRENAKLIVQFDHDHEIEHILLRDY